MSITEEWADASGSIPIIRCPRGNAAEMVARRLETKLRDHVAATTSQRGARDGGFGTDGLNSLQRPREFFHVEPSTRTDDSVLVILDRNIDLTSMLSHSWTYQALVHDVLDMKLNRVTVEVSIVCLSIRATLMVSLPRTGVCRRSPTTSTQRTSFGPRTRETLSHTSQRTSTRSSTGTRSTLQRSRGRQVSVMSTTCRKCEHSLLCNVGLY